ncbi:hypothetical protein GCM10011346_37290 [Oceanobacillus neutriphilus]|uniref:SCP domain-containing protein n=1 Tax=Oceanobacillus neutriphilus TaxID=531815 RepID=A0ABQ2NZL4_9BACI|nr:hypothetical protein GCM10011346_37290 [Oceanobacillus neutriphilus]
MKKICLFLFICLCLILNSSNSQVSSSKESGHSLTIKEAIELAYSDAVKWNEDAKLIDGTSVDNDEEPTGVMGNEDFGT